MSPRLHLIVAAAVALTNILTAAIAQAVPIIQIRSVERTSVAVVVKGTAAIVPPGTVFEVEVLSINGRPVGNRHKIQTVEKVSVGIDRTFEAKLQRWGSLDGFDFPKGQYQLEFLAHFNTAWQTPEIVRAVGVEVDDRGRTGRNAEPRKLPPSEDLKTTAQYGRVLRAIRTVTVGEMKEPFKALGKTRNIRLEIHDTAAVRNPVRTVNATDMLFREAKQAVGRVTPTQAVVLACVGPFPAGYIANDLFRSGGSVNQALGGDYATTLREMCHRMEQSCKAC